MASASGLPPGAFLTTMSGRRCTAVPRVAAVSASASASANSLAEVTTTTSSTVTTTANPNTGLAAAPVAEIDTSTADADQSSTSTTNFPLATITSTSPGSVRIAQAQDSDTGPSASPSTPLPAALLPTSGAAPQSFTAFADVSSSQASVAQSSQADSSATAAAVDTPASSSEPDPAETSPPGLPEGPAANPLLTTFEPPPRPTDVAVPDATGTSSADPLSTAIPTLNNNAVQSAVAVAGGVIGGVVALSLLAFFIWWWRRRRLRKRRSTLLTPLDAPYFDRDEKGGYVITRGSIGPTPMAEKVRAALGQNIKKIRGHIRNRTAPSVNLDRGTSQFIDPAGACSRANSGIIGAEPTTKDRLRGWWSGLGVKFNRRNQTAQRGNQSATQEKKAAVSSQPDFLTLLNMDDRELDREAQRRRASKASLNGSASSTDNFLGGLNLNFSNDDPFSDANAITRTSAKPAPLAVGSGSGNSVANPFSDTNAIRDPPPAMPKPTSYVADIRRSRSNSGGGGGRQPSTVYNYGNNNNNRESAGSLRSLATATTANMRNKFRSDPFDLERPELLGGTKATRPPTSSSSSSNSSTAATAGSATPDSAAAAAATTVKDPQYPARTRARADSFTSRYSKYSKYSSGVSVVSAMSVVESMGDWSDPGPDVGPAAAAAARIEEAVVIPDGNGTAAQGWRERLAKERERAASNDGGKTRLSGGSLGSVGKAM
ncbi:hypothetical protein C8A00DRAFT_30732 [Chaetomidium leptoderma]|uniref:Uncharacterized protein n=1 Tax=Chaetomidium leptoderma TaxID=669021 RepID=A0AAN6VS89_9PEZI|nr:hypothetical protein C8A00DRAFT_30732 [Chaetomidium leptoderma]